MKTRLAMFFIFTGIFTGAYYAGAQTEVSQEEAELFMEQFEDLVDGIDGTGIFVHNARIALPMFIPGVGVAWGLFSAWSTGLAFSAITATAPELAGISPLAVLYLTPFGIMELASYSLGISRSFILIRAVAAKRPLRPQLWPTAAEAGAVAALLLAGGHLEFYLIEHAPESAAGM